MTASAPTTPPAIAAVGVWRLLRPGDRDFEGEGEVALRGGEVALRLCGSVSTQEIMYQKVCLT